MSDVAARVLRSLDPALKRAGCSLDELLVAHDLSPRMVWSIPGHRVAWNPFVDVLRSAADRLGGPDALDDVGANSLIWRWDTIRAVVSRYVTPFTAFQLGVRWFCPAIFRGVRGYLTEVPGGLIETVVIPPDRRDSIEFFALCRGVMRQFPTLLGWETASLEFRHFDHRAEYRLQFVRSSARKPAPPISPRDAVLDQDLEELAILHLDPTIPATPETPQAPQGAELAERIRSMLRKAELGMADSSSEAAHRLATSERSLARRLAAGGTSYRAIRDEIRREVALERVQAGVPIAEIAYALGFADVPSFHRAFRRWTGQAPGSFKRDRETPSLGAEVVRPGSVRSQGAS